MTIQKCYNFEHRYDVVIDFERTGFERERIYYFSNSSESLSKDGLQLKIIPESGRAWIGIFTSQAKSAVQDPAIYSCPDAGHVCVINGGNVCIVNVMNPDQCLWVNSGYVKQVMADTYNKLLLFVNGMYIQAYGDTGQVWKTKRLSWDGIRIKEIGNDFLCGEAYDPTNSTKQWKPFKVNLKTGGHEGGSFKEA